MANELIIFGAKYLYLSIGAIALIYFLKQPRGKQKDILIFSLITLPLIYLVGKLAGFLYYSPRPFVAGGFTPLIPHAPDNGFPSDHVLLASAVAAVLYPYNRLLSLVLWGLTALVGISRVYAGIHSPIDIMGSIVISILVAVSVYAARNYYFRRVFIHR